MIRSWRRLAPATQKSLANWMLYFQRRNTQYQQWVDGTRAACFVNLLGAELLLFYFGFVYIARLVSRCVGACRG